MLSLIFAMLALQSERTIIVAQVDGRPAAFFTDTVRLQCDDTPITVTYTSGWGNVDARIKSATIGRRRVPPRYLLDLNRQLFGTRRDRLAFGDCYYEPRDKFNGVEVIISGTPGARYVHLPLSFILKDR